MVPDWLGAVSGWGRAGGRTVQTGGEIRGFGAQDKAHFRKPRLAPKAKPRGKKFPAVGEAERQEIPDEERRGKSSNRKRARHVTDPFPFF